LKYEEIGGLGQDGRKDVIEDEVGSMHSPKSVHFPISSGIFPFKFILLDRSNFFCDLFSPSHMFFGISESSLFLWRSRLLSDGSVPKRDGIVPVNWLPSASK
jgi:hypothetical protein